MDDNTGLFLGTLNREFGVHQSANMGGTKGTQRANVLLGNMVAMEFEHFKGPKNLRPSGIKESHKVPPSPDCAFGIPASIKKDEGLPK